MSASPRGELPGLRAKRPDRTSQTPWSWQQTALCCLPFSEPTSYSRGSSWLCAGAGPRPRARPHLWLSAGGFSRPPTWHARRGSPAPACVCPSHLVGCHWLSERGVGSQCTLSGASPRDGPRVLGRAEVQSGERLLRTASGQLSPLPSTPLLAPRYHLVYCLPTSSLGGGGGGSHSRRLVTGPLPPAEVRAGHPAGEAGGVRVPSPAGARGPHLRLRGRHHGRRRPQSHPTHHDAAGETLGGGRWRVRQPAAGEWPAGFSGPFLGIQGPAPTSSPTCLDD